MTKDERLIAKELWEKKTDDELITASEHLSDYSKELEEIILEELQRRKLSVPEPTVQKPEPAIRPAPAFIKYSLSGRESALSQRYNDAFLVAKVTVGIGSIFKTIGIVLACLIFVTFFGIGSYASAGNGGLLLVGLIGGAFYAFIVGSVFYVIGIIVSANGQILNAALDNTVGNSPFLTNDLKARIMSLPDA